MAKFGSMDSAINALASSAVADIYYPLRRRRGHAVDPSRDTSTPKLAVAAMGACMSGLGMLCAYLYDPHDRTLLDFAQAFGLQTVAEFVENGEVAKILMSMGVDFMTTFLLTNTSFPRISNNIMPQRSLKT